MLREMRENGEGFYPLARRLSTEHARHFREYPLSEARRAQLDAEAAQSIARQAALEAEEQEDFDTFLARYFAQT
jgi:glutamate--cysteine ligase